MKKRTKIILSFILTFILLYLLFIQVDLGEIFSTLISFNFSLLIIAFVLYLFSYILRAIRISLYLNKIRFIDIFSVVCLHNFFINILPLRSGELSYLYLLKKYNIKFNENLSSLFIIRFFDGISLLIIFLTSFILIDKKPEILFNFFFLILFILTLSILLFLFLYILNYSLKKRNIYIFKIFKNNIRGINNKRTVFLYFLISFLIWFSLYSINYVLFKNWDIELTLWQVIIISSLPLLISFLPINTLFSIGTFEGGFILGMSLFGINPNISTLVSSSIHVIIICFFIIFGIFGYLLRNIKFNHSHE